MRFKQLIVFVAAIAVAGCGSKKPENRSEQDHTFSELGATPAREAPRPYVIAEAGVRFDPPATWDPARIEVLSRSGEEAADARPGAGFVVTFDYRAEQPGHHNSTLLSVYVMPKSAADTSNGTVIDSTADWIYVVSTPEENPYRTDLLDADQFEAMRLSFDDIRNSFTIEDGGPADVTLRADSKRK